VPEEVLTFLLGGLTVFGGGPEQAAAGDERAVAVNNFLGVGRLVMHRRVDVFVPATRWVMCGRIPFMTASVMNSLRRSCGRKISGWPLASVIPVWPRASLSMSRVAASVIGRFSTRRRRWNNRGAGGFQMRSPVVVDDERNGLTRIPPEYAQSPGRTNSKN